MAFLESVFFTDKTGHPSGQNVQRTTREIYNMMGVQLADRSGLKSISKWNYVGLADSH